MNSAITALQNLVGSLPATGTEATTVVGYIDEQIAAVSALISGKNVGATGETGENALISASATNNNVSVESTQKLKDAVGLAESAIQLSDLDTIGETAAANLVAAAIAAATTPANEGE